MIRRLGIIAIAVTLIVVAFIVLLESGANAELMNKDGESALSIAQSLKHGGVRPIRPDLTAEDFEIRPKPARNEVCGR